MFNFTTLSIYNQVSENGANRNLWYAAGKKPVLRIGNTRFDKELIESILIKNPTKENLAKVTFDLSKVIPEEGSTTGRIVLYIGLSMNCQDAFYANDFVYKGKPLFIEFPVSADDTADILATRVKKISDKYLIFNLGTEKMLTVTSTATAASGDDAAVGEISFEGVNGYQLIKQALLLKWNPEAKTVDCCTKDGDFETIVKGVPAIYTTNDDGEATIQQKYVNEDGIEATIDGDKLVAIAPGLESFGDYNWILHNLRLPTAANYYPWSPSNRMGEMPIPGQVYTQFIITMRKDRDGIAGSILGQRATTITTHVLYVAGKISDNGSAAKLVKDKLTSLLGADYNTKAHTDADDTLKTPFANL